MKEWLVANWKSLLFGVILAELLYWCTPLGKIVDAGLGIHSAKATTEAAQDTCAIAEKPVLPEHALIGTVVVVFNFDNDGLYSVLQYSDPVEIYIATHGGAPEQFSAVPKWEIRATYTTETGALKAAEELFAPVKARRAYQEEVRRNEAAWKKVGPKLIKEFKP